MADYINKKRCDSWGECYLEKGKESGNFGSIARGKLSFFDDLPKKHASYKAALKGDVAEFNYGNFILIPVGTNKVRCIHSCFLFSELEKDPLQVIGILGSRRTSPFKSLNIDQAVKRLQPGPLIRLETKTGYPPWKNS
jgi:hypothetical protein